MKGRFDDVEVGAQESFEEMSFEEMFEGENPEAFEYQEFEGLGESEELGEYEETEWEAAERRGSGATSPPSGRGQSVTFPPEKITVRPIATLHGFCFAEHSLMERHIKEIQAIARTIVGMARRGPISIRLVGHTDPVGSKAANIQLGMRRAQEVGKKLRMFLSPLLNRLQRSGVRLGRINIVEQSRGEDSPVASNSTPRGRASNRRVQIFVTQPPRP